jgi:hypothetical protein
MKTILSGLLIFSFLTFGLEGVQGLGPVRAEGETKKAGPVHFLWAFGALKKTGGDLHFVPIEKDTTLTTGDQLKIFMELRKTCFVYVLYRSSQGKMHVLFPSSLKQPEDSLKTKEHVYIPQGEDYFQLDDHVGLETFYLIASAWRLTKLEKLVEGYGSAGPKDKDELALQIISEIRHLRKKHRKLKASAERPVQLVGTIRGSDKKENTLRAKLSTIAVEVSADDVYIRTFTIDHQ